MSLILRGLLVMATAGALSLPSNVSFTVLSTGGHGRTRPVVAPTVPHVPTTADFKTTQLEYYLGDDGIAYIRPGLKFKVNSVTNVGPGQNPVIDFNITDNFSQPLDLAGQVTPGAISPGFILSAWNPTTRYYHTYTLRTRNGTTNPSADSGGTYTTLELGHYLYKFGTKLPADFDTSQTMTLGVYGRRDLRDQIGKYYYADNVFFDFRPDGGSTIPTWGKMDLSKSCNRCHDPLAMHGGTRRDPHMCVMCHNDQIGDGVEFNARNFFHKIHNGNAGGDFSDVVFPQDIRNCTTCHDTDAKEADVWYTKPSRLACGSCHDDINWDTGANHPGGSQANDDECADCHVPDSGLEFDASIKGAHTVPTKSKQLAGLNVAIMSVTNTDPGDSPTVVFKITNNDGSAVDGTQLDTFSPILAGPTSSYRYDWRENAKSAGVFNAADGTTTYTFSAMIPDGATGTWTISGDFYRFVNLTRGDGGPDIQVREAAMNPIQYFAVTGPVTPRRMSVDINNCNVCHDQLALHGGQRMTTLECVICHNPLADDSSQRPADQLPAESISFQRMIHRIHTGENLTQDYTIYGYHGSVNTFNDVVFPGDTMDCAKCHTSGSYIPPLPTGIDSVVTLRDYFSPQGPSTAACLGCHDNSDAAAHAWLNTTTFPGWDTPSEACATCHGAGKDWSVDKVHAR